MNASSGTTKHGAYLGWFYNSDATYIHVPIKGPPLRINGITTEMQAKWAEQELDALAVAFSDACLSSMIKFKESV